jgi:putative transcriptional regulator
MAAKSLIRTGQLLLAEPFMQDPYFKRAVVLLCEHHEQGSLGFILNKGIDMSIAELIPDFPPFEGPVFYGGPVHTDTLHYIHNVGDLLEGSSRVSDGVWWGGDFENLKFLIQSELIGPDNIRFFIGYSGWSTGQLEEEMESGSWVMAPMHANYAFKSQPEDLWSQVMYNKGDLFEIISDMPEQISWN